MMLPLATKDAIIINTSDAVLWIHWRTCSLRTSQPKTTFDTNWIDPSAASSDCAAKPNDTKLATLPRPNSTTPICHERNRLWGTRTCIMYMRSPTTRKAWLVKFTV